MAFITVEDFSTAIRNNILDEVSESDNEKVEKAISRAIKYVSGHLANRYDVENIFNKEGDQRDEVVLGICIDIALVYLHRLINPRKVPANRGDAYREAKEWLDKVSSLEINPPDLPVLEGGVKDYVVFGSNKKRINHI